MTILDVFAARHDHVSTMINSSTDKGAVAGMKMLADKELSQLWRIKVLLLPVFAIGDWFKREKQRLDIESMWENARLMIPEGQNATADTFLAELRTGFLELRELQRTSVSKDHECALSTALAESAIRDVDETAKHSQPSAKQQRDDIQGLTKTAGHDPHEDGTVTDIPDVGFSSHPDGSCIVEASSDSGSAPVLLLDGDSDSTSTSDEDQSGTEEEDSEDDEDDEADGYGEEEEDEDEEAKDRAAGALASMNYNGLCTKVPNELRIRVRNAGHWLQRLLRKHHNTMRVADQVEQASRLFLL